MIKLKSIIQGFKYNIPILISCFYILGYIYMNRYYSSFDISIEYYVNLTDIIFLTVNYLMMILIIYVIFELVSSFIANMAFYVWSHFFHKKTDNLKNERVIERFIDVRRKKSFQWISLSILIVIAFGIIYFSGMFMIYTSIFVPLILIKVNYLVFSKTKVEESKKKISNFFVIVFSIISIICFAYWGYYDGVSNKIIKKDSPIVSFTDNNNFYSTKGTTFNLIGETSGYLFLYDIKNKESLVFAKQNIRNFKIQDPEILEKKMQDEINRKFNSFRKDIFSPKDE